MIDGRKKGDLERMVAFWERGKGFVCFCIGLLVLSRAVA